MGRLPVSNIAGPLSYVHDDLVAYDGIAGQREEGGVLLALAVMQALLLLGSVKLLSPLVGRFVST